ncbi:MAG: hypothetical protein IT427_08705 [Pirellulales bacterium]|nr:hypothetical protein [Pirellulales bacterium]
MSSWITSTIVLTLLYIVGHVAFTVWVTIGGYFDLLKLLHDLKDESVDTTDNGRVTVPRE